MGRQRKIDQEALSQTNRAHLSFSDNTMKKVEDILAETGISSASELFRQAAIFYTLAYDEHKKGSEILIRNKDGSIEKLRMFM